MASEGVQRARGFTPFKPSGTDTTDKQQDTPAAGSPLNNFPFFHPEKKKISTKKKKTPFSTNFSGKVESGC